MAYDFDRRRILKGAGAFAAVMATPALVRAQAPTLKVTSWGGKWAETLQKEVIPSFEAEFKCKVTVDSALPYITKLQSSPRNNPIYDVLHTAGNEMWQAADLDLVEAQPSPREIPNLSDCYPLAYGSDSAGVTGLVSAMGLAHRTDQNISVSSWKDFWDAKYAGRRAGYVVPINALGQLFVIACGRVWGSGNTDLEAAYAALEKLKPLRLVDFTGAMERSLISGEFSIGVLHDSGVYRYYDQPQRPPVKFVAPSEGVMSLEQGYAVTKGSPLKQLGYAYINHLLDPKMQKIMCEAIWQSPVNKKVKLDGEAANLLFTSEEKIKTLIKADWRWYNANKSAIDARVTRIFRA